MTINVLTGGAMPRLLQDIVRTLVQDEPDIHVEAEGLSVEEILTHLQAHETDVVIVGCKPDDMDAFGRGLLERVRRTRVIAVAARDCDAVLYQLTPISHALGQLSVNSLLRAIRDDGASPEAAG